MGRLAAGLALAATAALAPGVATAASTVTSGGGTASVTNKGTVHFALNARARQSGELGAGSGTVIIRGDEGVLRLEVVCMTTSGDFSFIETRDPATGAYYDVTVQDNEGSPDHFAYSGPWGDAICSGGIAQEASFVTSGNVVVRP